MGNKKNVSFIINIILFILLIIGFVLETYEHVIQAGDTLYLITRFRYFTELSNIFMGIVGLVYALNLMNKKEVSNTLKIMKLFSTSGVTVTCLTVLFYLIPVLGDQWYYLVTGSQFVFHLAVPILAFITFVFLEDNKVDKKYVFLSVIPLIIYGIFYMSVALTHKVDGKIDMVYDWYLFLSNGLTAGLIAFAIMIVANTFIVFVLNSLSGKFIKK